MVVAMELVSLVFPSAAAEPGEAIVLTGLTGTSKCVEPVDVDHNLLLPNGSVNS
jgi:hypothetical protein